MKSVTLGTARLLPFHSVALTRCLRREPWILSYHRLTIGRILQSMALDIALWHDTDQHCLSKVDPLRPRLLPKEIASPSSLSSLSSTIAEGDKSPRRPNGLRALSGSRVDLKGDLVMDELRGRSSRAFDDLMDALRRGGPNDSEVARSCPRSWAVSSCGGADMGPLPASKSKPKLVSTFRRQLGLMLGMLGRRAAVGRGCGSDSS